MDTPNLDHLQVTGRDRGHLDYYGALNRANIDNLSTQPFEIREFDQLQLLYDRLFVVHRLRLP